ncbi:MAG TPA: ABC transporter substrate-binding protein [Balneolaceae bacterium]
MKILKNPFYKKAQLLILSLLLVIPTALQAQSFEEGVNFYRQGKYDQAVSIFSNINSDKAMLFAGKSYFAMGKYTTAKAYLEQLTGQNSEDLFLEAQYTLALVDFQLGQFGDALNRLHQLQQREIQTQIVVNAEQFYSDILDYLTLNQRRNAFQETVYPKVKYDIVASAFGRVDYAVAQTLYNQLVEAKIDTANPQMQKLSKVLSDSVSYAVEVAFSGDLQAPEGITYNIGAALPSYTSEDPEFSVAQGLYFGYVMAAEQFNRQNANKKAFIRYQNTGATMDSAAYAMTNLAWNYNADVVLGPLFSEQARSMAEMAEQYQIPLVAPLANSHTLNVDNPYVYQANPTFISHGQKMAAFAVNELNMDTLAVLVEQNSLGEASAFAFRNKAEKLGAKVVYFFVENLESKGYELTDYTKYFTTDAAVVDSLNYPQVDAIYAPFTGQVAPTLIELLLVDLDAMNSNITVLGSQAWGNVQIPEQRLQNRKIYFSESYYINQKSREVQQFKKRYKERFDMEPNRFAMIGYDVASYVLQTIDQIANPALLKDALKRQPMYEGLISNINFDGTHINQEVKIFEVTEYGIRPSLK